MAQLTATPLSALVREQMAHPSPIRQIMKMAERQNIIAMGLKPEDVISFGGGWVNHAAPEGLRRAYEAIVDGRGEREARLHLAHHADEAVPRRPVHFEGIVAEVEELDVVGAEGGCGLVASRRGARSSRPGRSAACRG